MKIFTNKKIIQRIIIAVLIVLSFNFVVPTYSQAGFGGVLMGPFIDFFAGIGDAVMSALQFFMYDGNITVGNTAGGAVSGALTIINPFDSFLLLRSANNFNDKLKEYDMDVTDAELAENGGANIPINADNFDKGLLGWLPGSLLDKNYGVPIIKYTPEKIFSNQVPALDVNFINPIDWTDIKDENGNQKYPNADLMNERSITHDLHSTIANWYLGLRNLAIVALLSILLYVGIRMVISSTASDKAKYKQMIMDWLIALCIVFFLHYIMSFILTVTQMITEGVDSGTEIIVEVQDTVSGKGNFNFKTDLTGLCRFQVQYSDLGSRMIYLIFYLALVIYTVMFTWTYVKRAITMAFLTLMAPLVAITYPIDKISDGKAQAYGIWLKEFIFNALLQPFHLIVYTIFLGAASEIATKNPIYAILFLAFIIPSEKLLRKMFGFDKSSTAGAMGAAASMLGGAAVMKSASNFIGKVGKGKGGSGKAGVRTKNTAITDPNAPSKVKDMASTLGGTAARENQESRSATSVLPENVGVNPSGDGYSRSVGGVGVPSGTAGKAGVRTKNTAITDPNAPSKVKDMASTLGGTAARENQESRSATSVLPENVGVNPSGDGYSRSVGGVGVPSGTATGTRSSGAQQQLSQQTQARNRSLSTNAVSSPWKTSENDTRGMGQWLGDGLTGTLNKKSWGRKVIRGANSIRNMPNALSQAPGKIIDKAKFLPKPVRNTIKGAVGTASKAAIGTAKFAGKAAVGATFGLAAGIAGDDLEDVFKFGAAGAALGVAGLPVIGRGISSAASDMRSTYETEAFGADEAALRAQSREQMKNEEYRDNMDKLYEEMYGTEPTSSESKSFAKHGIEYYNAGVTSTKEIKKSMKFEKELKDKMIADGAGEEDASERAKKQAMVISSLASKVDDKELINESKRNDRRNQFYKQLKDTGMDEKSAAKGADYTIELLMKRKGLSPN